MSHRQLAASLARIFVATALLGAAACADTTSPAPAAAVADDGLGLALGAATAACSDTVGCAPGQHCRRPLGQCGGAGFCVPLPKQCPPLSRMVCGCDGQSYANGCVAARAGVGLVSAGYCGRPVGCDDSAQCPGAAACVTPPGECGGVGHCVAVGPQCSNALAPVCGCDGGEYRNRCAALAAGVSVDHAGQCEDACAGFEPPGCTQAGCPAGQVCDTTVGCNPSFCSCDPSNGGVICTEDCGGGTCVDDTPVLCCDPANEPGQNGNPFCFEGASCCSNGKWACNEGDGSSTCEAPGKPCAVGCEGFEPPGCNQGGCDEGFVCGPSVGCVPSHCECDAATGAIICTKDCGGGTCVPDGPGACCDEASEPGVGENPLCIEGASCCADGTWQCNNGNGTSSCDAPGKPCVDKCAGYVPPGCNQAGCPEGSSCKQGVGCTPSICSCDPSNGFVICTADCNGGTCVPDGP
jgi:hypothetical protein